MLEVGVTLPYDYRVHIETSPCRDRSMELPFCYLSVFSGVSCFCFVLVENLNLGQVGPWCLQAIGVALPYDYREYCRYASSLHTPGSHPPRKLDRFVDKLITLWTAVCLCTFDV